jgi:hypothetical protein
LPVAAIAVRAWWVRKQPAEAADENVSALVPTADERTAASTATR